ncbi:helix-turn-helix transcriptional regulator [Paracoccus sp. J55]|uniref:helix-turn-helix transcriptional regulator n=1 Tax=Paracoccus sp. J55 TaxID=935849 RepID=UPI000A04E4B8
MRNQNIYNLRSNLRNLISEMESISFAAAALGINRQQLNKYLSGTSTPSLRSLSHIAARFKVPVEDLFLPPQDFQEARNNAIMRANIPADVSDTITRMLGSSPVIQDKLALYCGTYHRLCAMPMTPRKIMRAVTRIYQRDGLTYATTVEVFSERGSPFSDPRHMRKLHALIVNGGAKVGRGGGVKSGQLGGAPWRARWPHSWREPWRTGPLGPIVGRYFMVISAVYGLCCWRGDSFRRSSR